jgi:hypothetical protein
MPRIAAAKQPIAKAIVATHIVLTEHHQAYGTMLMPNVVPITIFKLSKPISCMAYLTIPRPCAHAKLT